MAFEDEITDLKRRLVAAEELLHEMAISSTAVRASEQRFRTLFGKLGQGFCELELIRGVDGRVSDLKYIFVNPAHERLAGIKAGDAVGRTTRELVPTFDPSNFALYDEAVNSGSHLRVEYEVPSLGRWYEVYIYPSSNDRVFVFYEDFTDRKRKEQALRDSEERQRFLLELGDTMRSLSDPVEIIATASQHLGKHLGLDRCFFGEVDRVAEHVVFQRVYCAPGVSGFPGHVRLEDFGTEFLELIRTGSTLVVDDVAADPRLSNPEHVQNLARAGVAACVGVPLIKSGDLVAILSAHQTRPRSWTASDIALLEDVAERTWAVLERTRAEAALRESERKALLLLAELQHRVRNIMAMIRSVARRTAETADTVKDYVQHLEGRISAMARTQALLTREMNAAVDLETLISDELQMQAARPEQYSLTGVKVLLPPKAAEVLGLALHELATNAVKYGALSERGRRVEVRWVLSSAEEAPRLSLIWSEVGGKVDREPKRSGFGTELITQRVPYELKGNGKMEFRADGVVATIEFPLEKRPSILQTDDRIGEEV